MKVIVFVSSVFLSGLLVGCVKPKSVAAEYRAKLASGSSDAVPAEDSAGASQEADSPPEDPVAAAKIERGTALLEKCSACHGEGLPAAKVTLDSTAVARLTAAYEGANKANHMSLQDAFVTGRADLEAALNSITGLRLQDAKIKAKK